MKSIFLAAALLAAAPAQAQTLPLTPELYNGYARVGAAEMALNYIRKGDTAKACIVAQHIKVLQGRDSNITAEDSARVERLISQVCTSSYSPAFNY